MLICKIPDRWDVERDLRDFKAVNWPADLKLDLGAGAWSEGTGVQKNHRTVILILGSL